MRPFVKVDITETVTKRLQVVMAAFTHGRREIMDVVLTGVIAVVTRNFKQGGRPSWRPLSQLTLWGRRGEPSRARMLRDTGALMNSVTGGGGTSASIRIVSGLTLTYGTNLKYAGVHDPNDGAAQTVITPKRAKMLAIPLNPKARRVAARVAYAQEGLHIIRSRAGNILLVKDLAGKRGRETRGFEVWYWLTPKVTIPARPFLTVTEADARDIGNNIVRYLAYKFRPEPA